MYYYPIYTIDTWSMLTVNNPTLMSMCCSCFYKDTIVKIIDSRLCFYFLFLLYFIFIFIFLFFSIFRTT